MVVAALVLTVYPETANRSLEELNPATPRRRRRRPGPGATPRSRPETLPNEPAAPATPAGAGPGSIDQDRRSP